MSIIMPYSPAKDLLARFFFGEQSESGPYCRWIIKDVARLRMALGRCAADANKKIGAAVAAPMC